MTGLSGTILIVDDDEDIMELLENGISPMGDYRIVTASSGSEALEIIENDPPDLIFLDIMMKDMDGTQVCRIIKGNEKTAHIPVIALTIIHKADRHRYNAIMEAGVDEYMTKPFSFEELKGLIERYLASS